MAIWGWANFVLPDFHCCAIHVRNMPANRSILDFVLLSRHCRSGLGEWWRPGGPGGDRKLSALAVITFLALVLALGNNGYLYAWLKHVLPWIGFARYPIKFVSIPVFTIPLLAACGLNCFRSAFSFNSRRNERLLWLSATFLSLTVLLLMVTSRWRLVPSDGWQSAWQDGTLRVLFLIATVGAVGLLIRVPTLRLRSLVGFAVLMLVGIDLVVAGLSENPTVVTRAFGPLELNMTSRPALGASRAMLSQQVISYLNFARTSDPLYYCIGMRGALMENCNIPENIPKVDGFCSLHLKDEWDIDGIFYSVFLNRALTNALPQPLLDFLGVSRISATNIFTWRERKTFLPLATAGQQPFFADAAETLRQLNSANFNPRHTVFMPLSEQGKLMVTNGSDARVVFQQFGAQQAHLTVVAPAPALVVIAQAFYHNWRAYVDGKPVPLLRANYAFQAVEVPAGQHEITLRYVDWMFDLGALISALTLLGCLACLFINPERKNTGS